MAKMMKKKELQAHFNVSYNTVLRTLEACGIPTGKVVHSPEEVAKFAKARELFRAKHSSEYVKQYFSTRSACSNDIPYLDE